jgi:ankyrin repeat protein
MMKHKIFILSALLTVQNALWASQKGVEDFPELQSLQENAKGGDLRSSIFLSRLKEQTEEFGWGHLHVSGRYGWHYAYTQNIDATDAKGRTPAFLAAEFGHLETLRFLISQRADLNKANNIGTTPLYVAALYGHSHIVKLLLESGAVNGANSYGRTPLHMAAFYGFTATVRVLLENKEHIDATDQDGKTPILMAVGGYGDVEETVKILIDNNADLNQEDHDGWSPALRAMYKNRSDILNLLLANGAQM